jgi:hypothetical protein
VSCAAGVVGADEELVDEQDVHASGRPPGRRGDRILPFGPADDAKGRSLLRIRRLRPVDLRPNAGSTPCATWRSPL